MCVDVGQWTKDGEEGRERERERESERERERLGVYTSIASPVIEYI